VGKRRSRSAATMQKTEAGRDAYNAGRNLTIVNNRAGLGRAWIFVAFGVLVLASITTGAVVAFTTSHGSTPRTGPSIAKSSVKPPPVAFTVRKENGACLGAWMVRKPLSALPKTPTDGNADWTPWVKSAGAVDADLTRATVVIQGTSRQAVSLTGIKFNVKHESAIHGLIVGPGCGGPATGAYVETNLDEDPPRIVSSSSDPKATVGETPNHYKRFWLPYVISETDPLVLIVQGYTQKYDCIWSVDIYWSSEEAKGIIHIDNNGTPFETSTSRYQTGFVYGVK